MIRNDIILTDKQKDKIFLEHREGIDPDVYRVGKIDDNILVWNPKNNKIMEYFFDDSSDNWFKLNIIYPDRKDYDKYLINREGQVIGYKGKIIKEQSDFVWGYPQVKIKGKYIKLHILLAKMFIPNYDPESKICIDHVNRNKKDYSFKNLKWSTIVENMNNINRPSYLGKRLHYSYFDKDHKNLDKEYTDEEIINIFGGVESRRRIYESTLKNNKVFNRYWEIIDLDLQEYLLSIGADKIDESLWVEHYSGKFSVHPLGLIKVGRKIYAGNTRGGGTECKHPEKTIKVGKTYRVHILVAEVFLNNNNPIENGLVIDHLNTNPLDNRVLNLKICSQKENMNNPKTKEKLSKKVIDPKGIIYNSLTDCSKVYNVTPTTIMNWVKRSDKNFNYI